MVKNLPANAVDVGLIPGSGRYPEKEMAAAAAAVASVVSDSVRPPRRQPTRLPCSWDSPGKNTGVACHFLLHPLPEVNNYYQIIVYDSLASLMVSFFECSFCPIFSFQLLSLFPLGVQVSYKTYLHISLREI